MDFIEGRFADTKDKGAFLLKRYVSGALDEVRCIAIGDTGERSDAARHDHHCVGRIRTAGHVRADIRIGLLANFAGPFAKDLRNEVRAAFEAKFLGDDPQAAVGGNEVDEFYSLVTLDSRQEVFQEQRPTGTGGGHCEVLGWLDGQKRLRDNWRRRTSIGTLRGPVKKAG